MEKHTGFLGLKILISVIKIFEHKYPPYISPENLGTKPELWVLIAAVVLAQFVRQVGQTI